MTTNQILITGATGFVGSRLCQIAAEKGFSVRRALRWDNGHGGLVVGDIGPDTDWSGALKDIDVVVHLAARVHVMEDAAKDSLSEFRRTNVDGTLNLAKQAAKAGVKRLVFLSSIKVNGEATRPGQPFTNQDKPDPHDPYALSKHEAEEALRRVEKDTGLEVVIIRPPLVYGPGVKANFLRLIQAVQKGVFLPLGKVNNKRSLVALDNLVDLILTCLKHPAAAGQTFLVSDGQDLSTPGLIRKIARAMGKKARLLPVPPYLLRLAGRIMGKSAEVERLSGSLQVDIGHTCETLGWKPVVSVDEQLKKIVEGFGGGRVE
jgi:nucleoside-diphosphate-sugar epimerase